MTTTMKLTLKELADKITPGPWEARKLEAYGFVIRGGKEGWEIFTPEYDVVANVQYGAPIRKQADAEAIALVPGLLRVSEVMAEALRRLHKSVVGAICLPLGETGDESDWFQCIFCRGRTRDVRSKFPHTDSCPMSAARAALAEWEKLGGPK